MSAPVVTQFFDWLLYTPVHKGWYQRELPDGRILYWYWSGVMWHSGGFHDLDRAFIVSNFSPDQNLPWRGLAVKP